MASLNETPKVLAFRNFGKSLHLGRLHSPKFHNSKEEILSPLLGNVPQNDDESERRQRRREKIEQLQRDNIGSPLTPAEKRKSLGAGIFGMTNAQLAEHYASCMKLSAENKINAKNAFGLHLIDYMAEFLRNQDGQTNFQVASCTLDASAKIYASRVDCVYANTFKIASGLNIAKESEKNNEEGDDSNDGDKGTRKEKEKKKKKVKKSNTIEQNIASLNYKKLDAGLKIDPLFIKMSGEFDTAGLNGFLFNTVIAHDGCELIINSKTMPSPYRETEENSHFEIPNLKETFKSIQEPNVEICPQLPDCSFFKLDTSMPEISDFENDSLLPPQKRCKSFLENTSVANNLLNDCNDDEVLFNDEIDDGEEMAYHLNEKVNDSNKDMLNGISNKQILPEDRFQNITDMVTMLADEPSEYSYFSHNLLCAWAGPAHWKLLRTNHNTASQKTASLEGEDKRKKKVAKVFKYNYAEAIDLESHFTLNPKSIMLTRKTMDNWSSERTTLPEDLHYDVRKFSQLFIKKIQVRRTTDPVEVNDENNDYNYNNQNDRENFCPNVQNESSDADIDGDVTGFPYDITTANVGLEKLPLLPVDENEINDGLGSLLEQPYKVPKVDIKYARTAKRIDIKHLKTKMWQVLTKCNEENKENVENQASLPKMDMPFNFSKLISSLPSIVPASMADNLSIPIVFVTLLYLVNEKSLSLEGSRDLSDFIISQG